MGGVEGTADGETGPSTPPQLPSKTLRQKNMSKTPQDSISELIQSVRAGVKYQAISEDLIRAVGLRELAARRNLKEAIKATKNKLHQVAGAYLDARPPYDLWLERLSDAAEARPGERESDGTASDRQDAIHNRRFQQVCLDIMGHHASTRERLAILDSFFATTLGQLAPVRSVLDVACGLNPLAIAWMPLAQDVSYYACDIYADMMAFLDGFFQLAGIHGQAQVCDLLSGPPRQEVDLALVLKALPPLEQLEKEAGRNLLRALRAKRILVSFPARSLGGRAKGMAENYEQRFRTLAEAEGWSFERFAFASELAFLVSKKELRS
jgi:16S rRNA (guanine(1405)-N(7))-methyltransferase